ncbi:ABC transporter ATP-binding protein [Streptomyces wuyuanensis]|uniref:ABC transporter ATP-binding protein n=1 Tax=Streptomyces wuyuanensis TaxID=1196353 RepID=UPI0036B80035
MVGHREGHVLLARSLHYSYHGSSALFDVSLGVRHGEILSVCGSRGSGKTTLMRCLSGQLVPQKGEVMLGNLPIHTRSAEYRERLQRHRFSWITAEPVLVPELNAWENAALPMLLRGMPYRKARVASHRWLEFLDMDACASQRPGVLLQSQRQRVAIARALLSRPLVLFADEPTAVLHSADQDEVLGRLVTAARLQGITVVLATQDTGVAAVGDRTIALVGGRRVALSTPAFVATVGKVRVA